MAYTVYGLQALANGLISQVKVVKLYASTTLVDTFTWDGTNTILVAGSTLGTLKKNDSVSIVFDVVVAPASTVTVTEVRLENGEASNNVLATIPITVPTYSVTGTYILEEIPITVSNPA